MSYWLVVLFSGFHKSKGAFEVLVTYPAESLTHDLNPVAAESS